MAEFFYCFILVCKVVFTLSIFACKILKYCFILIYTILKKEALFIWNSRKNLPVFFYVFQTILLWEVIGFALYMNHKDFLLRLFLPKAIEEDIFDGIVIPMYDLFYDLYLSPTASYSYQTVSHNLMSDSFGTKVYYLFVLVFTLLLLIIVLYHVIFLPFPAICGVVAQVIVIIPLALAGKRINVNMSQLFQSRKSMRNNEYDSDGCKILTEEERLSNIAFLEQMKQMNFSAGRESFECNGWPDGRVGGLVRYYADGRIEAIELPNGRKVNRFVASAHPVGYSNAVKTQVMNSNVTGAEGISNVHKREIRDEYQRAIANARKATEERIQAGYKVLKVKGRNLELVKAIKRCEETLQDFDEMVDELSQTIWYSSEDSSVSNAYVTLKKEIGKVQNANRDIYDLLKVLVGRTG